MDEENLQTIETEQVSLDSSFHELESAPAIDENDFITLSDILPSDHQQLQPELPDAPKDVFLETPTLIPTQDVYHSNNAFTGVEFADDLTGPITMDVSTNNYYPHELSHDQEVTNEYTTVPTEKKPTKKVPNKRGRKPKTNNPDLSVSNNHVAVPQIGSTPKRRGRPPKKYIPDDDAKSSSNQINGTVHNQKRGKKRGRPSKKSKDKEQTIENVEYLEDETDDLTLSKLKQNIQTDGKSNDCSVNQQSKSDECQLETKNTPFLNDFEYNLDNVISATNNVVVETMEPLPNGLSKISEVPEAKSEITVQQKISENVEDTYEPNTTDSLLVEDTSKRPVRRKTKRTYEIDSDEDPFANIELSDDEKPLRKKGKKKYYSDDEYVPDGVETIADKEDDADSDFDGINEERGKGKRVRTRKSSNRSPLKKKPEIKTVIHKADLDSVDDFEACLETTVIKSNDTSVLKQGQNEFVNFLANRMKVSGVQMKKVTNDPLSTSKSSFEVPDLKEARLPVDKSTQTACNVLKTSSIQTSSAYSIKMTKKLPLSTVQSENACEFLKSILNTTTELGKLMMEKSQGFVEKKINTAHVKNTMEMDYCIKKAFLLLKLAKDNLSTMEENLEKQYEEFLRKNKLDGSIETDKRIAPKANAAESDSDCEIVEEPVQKKSKPAFNPKTVVLPKELSIKIAKKPVPPVSKAKVNPKNIPNISKGNSVWLNENIMMKRVKPTQSFLAQDSRNKKPPDNRITVKMVRDFFKAYNRMQALEICAPYISSNWLDVRTEVGCNYHVIENEIPPVASLHLNSSDITENTAIISNDIEVVNNIRHVFIGSLNNTLQKEPKSLFTLCTETLCKKLNIPGAMQSKPRSTDIDIVQQPEKLTRMCLTTISNNQWDALHHDPYKNVPDENVPQRTDPGIIKCNINTVPKLKTLCFNIVSEMLVENTENGVESTSERFEDNYQNYFTEWDDSYCSISIENVQTVKQTENANYTVRQLKTIAFDKVQSIVFSSPRRIESENALCVKRLAELSFECLANFFNPQKLENEVQLSPLNILTIDNVNTLTEEAFLSLNGPAYQSPDNSDYDDGNYLADDDFDGREDNIEESSNWESHVQLEDCASYSLTHSGNPDFNNTAEEETSFDIASIKREIVEEVLDCVEPENIKREPIEHLNEMINIPDNLVPKCEIAENYMDEPRSPQTTHYDVQTFESFVMQNKLMHELPDYSANEIYSQSGQRIRRQHAPDSDIEDECHIPQFGSLLVPQDSEVFQLENAKDDLMGSSSENDDNNHKQSDKKRKKTKHKRPTGQAKQTKPSTGPDTPKKKDAEINKRKDPELNKKKNEQELVTKKAAPAPVMNEISVLTRRMREKIRQEEKKDESTDSEPEEQSLKIKTKDTAKSSCSATAAVANDQSLKSSKSEDAIQCNSIDSTEQIIEKPNKKNTKKKRKDEEADSFTGFSLDQQNEISSYHKYVTDVYEKILTEKNTERLSPVMIDNEPVELLECEPSIPMFEDPVSRKNNKPRPLCHKKKADKNCTVKHGWDCYQVNFSDPKLRALPVLLLDKLPEAFVDTYMKYQEITEIRKEDSEVDRLANLQSLHRTGKDGKVLHRPSKNTSSKGNKDNAEEYPELGSPAGSDRYDELTPSEDEGANQGDEIPQPVGKANKDNSFAKNLLMTELASDTESAPESSNVNSHGKTSKEEKGHKTSKKANMVDDSKSQPVVLTADKMMQKELDMLHAPVAMDYDGPPEAKEPKFDPSKPPSTKNKEKPSTSHGHGRRRRNKSDDSSSEEEKQWESTKSKLLKKMEKKVQDTNGADEAKRTKLVNEFIVRRDTAPAGRPSKAGRGSRRSRKKMLEHERQMQVLSEELYGQVPGSKKSNYTSYSYGRRNIRKVIDKKSLARSTVVANMEEFARKKRLAAKQARLRELLGYEEDVNVLVINDEVCLEYDFEENRPVVTIHPYFTKVMKAHQYEGVKFMWDASFESLERLESGSPGGGCVLAHCMGLGKTLQVLALLHTVLTHPRVGMQRVLVCCPLSTVLNWVDEIHKWLGPVTNKIKVFELSKLKKTYERAYQLEDWYNGGGIFIMGYELFRSLTTLHPEVDNVRPTIVNKIRHALLDPGPDIVVCDEGHLLKNDSSLLAVAVSRVKTRRRIILTGTPMQNNLREYYCMVNFIKPNLLGTYSEYSNRFENPIMNGQHRDSSEADIRLMKARTHILHKVLEGCLQRQEASVLYPYLPTKHEYTIFISLSPCQIQLYQHYLDHYAGRNKHKATNILKDFHTLQKIWSHPQVLHNYQMKIRDDAATKALKNERLEDELAQADLTASEDVKPIQTDEWWLPYLESGNMLDTLETSNKFVVVFRLLKECIKLNDKVLIFSTSLYTMDALEYFLKKINRWSLGQEYFRLDGSVPPEVRQRWCKEFNAENNLKTKLFLISTRAGCLGLNMTAANRVIILDTSWNPAHDIQSIFRVYRFGQKKDCYIYRLVALGTMEQKIYERSVTKQAVACRVVDEQQIDRHYNMAELTELYRFDVAGEGVAGGVAGTVRDVALLRVARDTAALHAAHEHDSLLRSTDQHLPEHERQAAWRQFQDEHGGTQMQAYGTLAVHKDGDVVEGDPPPPGIGPEPGPIKTEPSTTVAEETKKLGPKSKKKKSNQISCDIPIRPIEEMITPDLDPPPAPSITFVPSEGHQHSADVMKKITEALTKYQLQQVGAIIDPNEIAKVVSAIIEQSTATSEIPSEPQPEPEVTTRRGRPKKDAAKHTSAEETRPEKNDESFSFKVTSGPAKTPLKLNKEIPIVVSKATGRAQRRAAANANKKFAKTSQAIDELTNADEPAVIPREDNDDDYDAGDNFQNDLPDSPPPPQSLPGPASAKNIKKEPLKAKLQDCYSIVLSDDEDSATPPPPEPVIPFHKSLLTNKNFIKIVAHTYLKGNPMLDEDAATLAAEYSTTKALKELESTGVDITSGPIYDIAIQVLGKDVLRKLHEGDRKKNIQTSKVPEKVQAPPMPESSQVKEVPKLRIKLESQLRDAAPEPPIRVYRKRGRPLENELCQPTTSTTPTPAATSMGSGISLLKPSIKSVVQTNPVIKTITTRELIEQMKAGGSRSRTLKVPKSAAHALENTARPASAVAGGALQPTRAPQPQPIGEPISLDEPELIDDDVTLSWPTQPPSNIVPVGMFHGGDDNGAQQEECILPDDDDVRIVSHPYSSPYEALPVPVPKAAPTTVRISGPASKRKLIAVPRAASTPAPAPAPPSASAQAPPVPVSLQRAGPKPKILNAMISLNEQRLSSADPNTQVVVTIGQQGKIVRTVKRAGAASAAQPGPDTISLDSDDDEPPAPAPPAPPAPAPAPAPPPLGQPMLVVDGNGVPRQVYSLPTQPLLTQPLLTLGAPHLVQVPATSSTAVPQLYMLPPHHAPQHPTPPATSQPLTTYRTNKREVPIAPKVDAVPTDTTPKPKLGPISARKRAKEAAAAAVAAAAAKPASANINLTSKPPPPLRVEKPKPPTQSKVAATSRDTRRISISSNSSSDDSRPSSPRDPLADVLKNVVHIQAPTTADKQLVAKKSTAKPHTQPSSAKPQTSAGKPQSSTAQILQKVKDYKQKLNQKISLQYTDSSDRKIFKEKSITPKATNMTVAGTSKDIILKRAPKAAAKPGLEKKATPQKAPSVPSSSSRIVHITKVQSIAANKDNKRKNDAPPSAVAKKPKLTQPKTLEEFNVDDFDDIIELE